jgi:hypothetical protein
MAATRSPNADGCHHVARHRCSSVARTWCSPSLHLKSKVARGSSCGSAVKRYVTNSSMLEGSASSSSDADSSYGKHSSCKQPKHLVLVQRSMIPSPQKELGYPPNNKFAVSCIQGCAALLATLAIVLYAHRDAETRTCSALITASWFSLRWRASFGDGCSRDTKLPTLPPAASIAPDGSSWASLYAQQMERKSCNHYDTAFCVVRLLQPQCDCLCYVRHCVAR